MDHQSFKARYDILVRDGRLGGGAFGTVYKAYDNRTDEWMAIKVAELKVVDGKEYSLITEYEATKAVALHRNIANYKAVYQFEEMNGVFDYAVMQYYPEGNLKQLTARVQLSATEKKSIAEGIIRGVDHLHRHGILHRDLKPSNILVSKTPRGEFIPKIADFGLAKFIDADKDQALSNSFIGGTLEYASPEQLFGQPLKANADLWSVGVLLFELFAGELPFSAADVKGSAEAKRAEIYKQIIDAQIPASIETCPPPYKAMIELCLIKDVAERVGHSGDLVEMLNIKQPKIKIEVPALDVDVPDVLDGETILISDNAHRYQELLVEAEQLLLDDDYDQAIKKYELALALQSDPKEAIVGLKNASKARQDFEEDLARQKAYTKLIDEAAALSSKESYAQAINVLDEALALMPEQRSTIEELVEQNRSAEAAKERAKTINAFLEKAEVSYSDERWQEAIGYYEKCLAAGLERSHIANKLADAEAKLEAQEQELERVAKYDAAIAQLKEALSTDSLDLAVGHLQAVKQYANSAANYQDLEQKLEVRQSFHALKEKGEMLVANGDLSAAIEALEQAATIDDSIADRLAEVQHLYQERKAKAEDYQRLLREGRASLAAADFDKVQAAIDAMRQLQDLDASGDQLADDLSSAIAERQKALELVAAQSQLVQQALDAESADDLQEASRLAHQAASLQTDQQSDAKQLADRLDKKLKESLAQQAELQKAQLDYTTKLASVKRYIEDNKLDEAYGVLEGLENHPLVDSQREDLWQTWQHSFNAVLLADTRSLANQRELTRAVDLIEGQDKQAFIAPEVLQLQSLLVQVSELTIASEQQETAGKFAEAIRLLEEAHDLAPDLAFLLFDIERVKQAHSARVEQEAKAEAAKKEKEDAEKQVALDLAELQTLASSKDYVAAKEVLSSLRSRIDKRQYEAEEEKLVSATVAFLTEQTEDAIKTSQFSQASQMLNTLGSIILSSGRDVSNLRKRLDKAESEAKATALAEEKRQREKRAKEEDRRRKLEAEKKAKAEKAAELKRQKEAEARKKQELAQLEVEKKRKVDQAYALVDQGKWSKAKRALQIAIKADPASAALKEKLAYVVEQLEKEKSKRRPILLYLSSGLGLALVVAAIAWWQWSGESPATDSPSPMGLLNTEIDHSDDASVDIQSLLASDDAEAMQTFLELNPDHPRQEEVEQKLGILSGRVDDQAFATARSGNTITDYETYKRAHPQGRHLGEAEDRIVALSAEVVKAESDDVAFDLLKQNLSNAAIEQFRKQYPKSDYLPQVDELEASLQAGYRKQDYQRAIDAEGLSGLRNFLARYQSGKEVELARAEFERRTAKIEEDIWQQAANSGTIRDIELYLNRFPGGKYVQEAKQLLFSKQEAVLWTSISKNPTIEQVNTYLTTYPEGEHVADVKQIREDLVDDQDWRAAQKANTVAAFQSYIDTQKDGKYIAAAQAAIDNLSTEVEVQEEEVVVLPPLVKAIEDGLQVISAGSFTLGCDGHDSKCDKDELPPRDVTMKGIAVAKYEVTQRLWRKVMGNNPSKYAAKGKDGCLSCPVENVSYDEVQQFINKLNQEPNNPYTYRLPTEAEWEYAATGGRSTVFAGSNDAGEVAVHNHPSGTVKVGSKKPNGYGLYDMSGNVSEWTSTWYSEDAYKDGQPLAGPSTGETKVIRGGSFRDKSTRCRINNRNEMYPDEKEANLGFRLVRSL